MQGPIAQVLALTCVGNAYLRGQNVSGFWPNASVFQFSRACDFRRLEEARDDLIAADPMAWFETLRDGKGLRLHAAPRPRTPQQGIALEEWMSVGFVGGGPAWIIEAVGGDSSILWRGHDRLGNRNDPQRKIWLNTYLNSGEGASQTIPGTSLDDAARALEEALTAIESLAAVMQTGWEQTFSDARVVLRAAAPEVGCHADIADYAGFDLAQRRVLGAASKGWVFGGMDSWNDMVAPEAHAQDYERMSEQLFRALIYAICALANSTYRG